MAEIPNLAGVATADLVEKIGGGNFQASYINWSRTLHLLRTHAPGWLPELVATASGAILHEAPQGAYLLIRFRHTDGTVTPEVPQAIMDTRNAAIPTNKVTARDITDTHRRGVCMAAALTFGLAYELWAKVALESGYAEREDTPAPAASVSKIGPSAGVLESLSEERQAAVRDIAAMAQEYLDADDLQGAMEYLRERSGLEGAEEQVAVSTLFKSYERAAMKKAKEGDMAAATEYLIRNRQRKAA